MRNVHPQKCQEHLHEAPELLIWERRCLDGWMDLSFSFLLLLLFHIALAEQRVLEKFIYRVS